MDGPLDPPWGDHSVPVSVLVFGIYGMGRWSLLAYLRNIWSVVMQTDVRCQRDHQSDCQNRRRHAE